MFMPGIELFISDMPCELAGGAFHTAINMPTVTPVTRSAPKSVDPFISVPLGGGSFVEED